MLFLIGDGVTKLCPALFWFVRIPAVLFEGSVRQRPNNRLIYNVFSGNGPTSVQLRPPSRLMRRDASAP